MKYSGKPANDIAGRSGKGKTDLHGGNHSNWVTIATKQTCFLKKRKV